MLQPPEPPAEQSLSYLVAFLAELTLIDDELCLELASWSVHGDSLFPIPQGWSLGTRLYNIMVTCNLQIAELEQRRGMIDVGRGVTIRKSSFAQCSAV